MSKPREWPRNRKWPPASKILYTLQTVPPKFVLADGTVVRGSKLKTKTLSLAINPPNINPLNADPAGVYKGSDGFSYIVKESFINRTTGVPMYIDWQLVIDQQVIEAIKRGFGLSDLKRVYRMITSFPAPTPIKKDALIRQILEYIRVHRKSLSVKKGVRL